MDPGEAATVDFHWTMPALTPGKYTISVAISDGNVEDFRVCDYVEDAIGLPLDEERPPADYAPRAYLDLHSAAVAIHRNSSASLPE
jgi:hypothetical protein